MAPSERSLVMTDDEKGRQGINFFRTAAEVQTQSCLRLILKQPHNILLMCIIIQSNVS